MADIVSRRQALAEGLSRYFTGRCCRNGHLDERSAKDRKCYSCIRERNRVTYERDPEARRAHTRAWRRDNPDKAKQQGRRRHQRDPSRLKTWGQQWASENPDRAREVTLESGRRWCRKNPDKVAVKRFRRTNAVPAWLSQADRDSIAEIYRRARRLTRTTGIVHHVDHIVPISGRTVCGLHVPWNLQILTAKANLAKTNTLLV